MKPFILVAALLLCGCANLLSESNSKVEEYASTQSSERAYRNLVGVIRACFTTGVAVDADYFPEAREGAIAVAHRADPSKYEFLKVSVRPSGSGSIVKAQWRQHYDKVPAAFPRWIEGDRAGCPHGT